jgi:hypothetical protein
VMCISDRPHIVAIAVVLPIVSSGDNDGGTPRVVPNLGKG